MRSLTGFICNRCARFGCCFFGLVAISLSAGIAHPISVDGRLATDRAISDYRRDVRTFVKLSRNDKEQIQKNAIFNLCHLHRELVSDSRFHSNQPIKDLRLIAGNRLKKYLIDVEKSKRRTERLARKNGLTVSDGEEERYLSGSFDESDDADRDREIDDSLFESYDSMGQFSGGPNEWFRYSGGRMAPPWDHGEELVDLIESTINPASWQSNGGSGVIRYYRPLRILVVGASMQIQNDTIELLTKLRAAGR